MTRREAQGIIYQVINSGIIDSELEEGLTQICNCIEADDFEEDEDDDFEEDEEF